jgi:DNA-binding IclR family transcriptional regulator
VSSTLLRGLRLLETVDFYGPLSISALARHLGVDKATASRMVAACEPEGWLARDADGVRIGPRAAMLGQDAVAGQSLRLAEPLVHAVCGVTGLLTQALGLVGRSAVVLASAAQGGARFPYGLTTRFPLWISASGKVVASQLSPAQLDAMLPADPLPGPAELVDQIAPAAIIESFLAAFGFESTELGSAAGSTLVTTRADLDAQLAGIVRDGVFLDRAELLPQTSCIAVPWPQPGLPATLVTITTPAVVAEHRPLIERTLRAAASPGATRESIVAAAAER